MVPKSRVVAPACASPRDIVFVTVPRQVKPLWLFWSCNMLHSYGMMAFCAPSSWQHLFLDGVRGLLSIPPGVCSFL